MKSKLQSFSAVAMLGAVLLSAGLAQADDSVMKVAGKVLQIGLGARAVGMGEAQSAAVDDVYALYWNPAGMARMRQVEVSLMHNAWFGGISSEYLGYGQPWGTGAFGVSLNYTNFGEFEKYGIDANNYPLPLGGKFSPFTLVVSAGYARWFGANLTVGGTLKLISEGVDTYNSMSVAADIGAQYQKLLPNLDLGLTVQNLGLPLQGFGLPLTVRAGLAYHVPLLVDPQKDSFILAADASLPVPMDQPNYINVGGEYWFENTLAVRGGYKVSQINSLGSASGLTAGVGLRVMDYTLDYAFNSFGELGLTHRISFTAGFGESKKAAAKKGKRTTTKLSLGDAAKPGMEGALTPKLSGLSLRTPVTLTVRAELGSSDKTRAQIQQAVFEIQTSDGTELEDWTLTIRDAQGKTLRTYAAQGNPGKVVWNGRDDNNRWPEETMFAVYQFDYTVKDGNPEQLSGKVYHGQEAGETRAESGAEQGKINPIYFDEGSYDLSAGAIQAISAAARVIKSKAFLRINVDGYCDAGGEKSQEFLLSQRRADAVARYLTVTFKIPLTAITLHARGSKNAAASNQTAEGRAKNRRVEISVVNAR
jgi:outer membrane protein OmpA-like peptidoglycan-associated protein